MGDKLDYKKEYRDLYMPKRKPSLVDVPPMNFIMIDGAGDPSDEAFRLAVGALYALTFTIKMSKMSGEQPPGYFEYVVPPPWKGCGGYREALLISRSVITGSGPR